MNQPTPQDTQAGFAPAEGQAFYFTSKPPAKPEPRRGWLLPLVGSIVLVPLLMLGFGLSQQQQTTTATTTPSPSPAPSPSPVDSPTPTPSAPVPSTETSTQPQQPPQSERLSAASVPLSDQPALAVVTVHCPGVIANFRTAPSLHSLVLDAIPDGALLETTNRRVSQDGVTWQEVRYRHQMGWVASNFIGVPTNANP